jgi:hypothetical protein
MTELYLRDVERFTVLRCPFCEGDYLHHVRVEVFERSEDEPNGLHVSIAGKTARIDSDLAGNPSSRRHGLKIYFRCEMCARTSVLSLAQHKGQTHLEAPNG